MDASCIEEHMHARTSPRAATAVSHLMIDTVLDGWQLINSHVGGREVIGRSSMINGEVTDRLIRHQ